jgi:hypothetical protein
MNACGDLPGRLTESDMRAEDTDKFVAASLCWRIPSSCVACQRSGERSTGIGRTVNGVRRTRGIRRAGWPKGSRAAGVMIAPAAFRCGELARLWAAHDPSAPIVARGAPAQQVAQSDQSNSACERERDRRCGEKRAARQFGRWPSRGHEMEGAERQIQPCSIERHGSKQRPQSAPARAPRGRMLSVGPRCRSAPVGWHAGVTPGPNAEPRTTPRRLP